MRPEKLAASLGWLIVAATSCATIPTLPQTSATPSVTPAPVGDPQRLRDEIRAVERLLPRLPDRGSALYLLAHHYARPGEQPKALALRKECVALDEGFNPASLKLQPKTYLTSRADLAVVIAGELKAKQYVREPVFVTSRAKQQSIPSTN